jgi:predicted nucleic acid-binding protein
VALVLDAVALAAIDRRARAPGPLLKLAGTGPDGVLTSAAAVAQVWRNGSRQANLARLLQGIEILPLSAASARRVGELLAVSRTRDIVDAHIALLVHDGDVVLTSDPGDIGRLIGARGVAAAVVKV